MLQREYDKTEDKRGLPRLDVEHKISELEMEDNEDELIRLCHDKFLAGQDTAHFNYELIDEDEELDDVQNFLQDEEDQFFDKEEPAELTASEQYTGEQDF